MSKQNQINIFFFCCSMTSLILGDFFNDSSDDESNFFFQKILNNPHPSLDVDSLLNDDFGIQSSSSSFGEVGLIGPRGKVGDRGPGGLIGAIGATGMTGMTGLTGATGATGVTGAFLGTLSAFGEALVVRPTTVIQLQFPYNINSDYVNGATGTTTTGSGTVSYTRPFAVVSTTAATNSTALLNSKNRLHYQPGQGGACLFTAIFTPGVTGSTQLIGLGNLSSNTTLTLANLRDGFFFGYNGASFGIFHYKNGTATFIAQSSWNGDKFNGTGPSGVTLIPTNGNVFKIKYQWLGFGAIKFFIENPSDGSFVLVHTIQYANANTTTSLLNPSLQLMLAVSNTTNATNISLRTSSMAAVIEGAVNPDQDVNNSVYRTSAAVITDAGVNPNYTHILTIHNKPIYQSVTNQVVIYLRSLSVMNLSNNDVYYTLFLNPTFGLSPTYVDVDTANSVVEADTTTSNSATASITGGKQVFTFYATKNSTIQFDLHDHEIILIPNDVLVIAGKTVGGNSDAYASLMWVERF